MQTPGKEQPYWPWLFRKALSQSMILEVYLFNASLFPDCGDGCHTALKNDEFVSDLWRINRYGFYLRLILYARTFYINVRYHLADTMMQFIRKVENKAFCTLWTSLKPMDTLHGSDNVYISNLKNILHKDHLSRHFKKNCTYHCIDSIQSTLFGFNPDCVNHSVLTDPGLHHGLCLLMWKYMQNLIHVYVRIKIQISEEVEICPNILQMLPPVFNTATILVSLLFAFRLASCYK